MVTIQDQIMEHLRFLTEEVGCRPVGSEKNNDAAEYIENVFKKAGMEIEIQEFAVPDWETEEAYLILNGERIDVRSNTFSSSCEVEAEIFSFCTVEELERASGLEGKIAFLYGELSKENYVAKGFTMYNPEHHQKVIRLLEQKNPAAVITVRLEKQSDSPIFNDWDFKLPSVTVKPEAGLRLINASSLKLVINSSRKHGTTKNVIGRIKGANEEKIIVTAHYDTVFDTYGAFDNASGISMLLALAEEIVNKRELPVSFEFIAFSSEEYQALGDQVYLNKNDSSLYKVIAAMNFDGIGQALGTNNITLMAGSGEFEEHLKQYKSGFPAVEWTKPWYESNHTTFVFQGVPSIPFSCTGVADILHTPEDQVKWISPEKMMEVYALAIGIIETLQDKNCEWTRSKQ